MTAAVDLAGALPADDAVTLAAELAVVCTCSCGRRYPLRAFRRLGPAAGIGASGEPGIMDLPGTPPLRIEMRICACLSTLALSTDLTGRPVDFDGRPLTHGEQLATSSNQ